MLPTKIAYILNFFDCFGYNTGSSTLTRYQKCRYFIQSIHICLAITFTFYKIYMTIEMYYCYHAMDVINLSVQYSSPVYTYWMIILDSIVQRYHHQHFWSIYECIYHRFCHKSSFVRNFVKKIVAFFVVYVILFIILNAANDFNGGLRGCIYLALIITCEIRIFYYLFCIEIIHFQLKVIEHTAKTIQISTCFEQRLYKLKWICEYYRNVHRMINLLHNFFGWSNVAIILFCFYTFATYLNWTNAHFYEFVPEKQFCK